MSVTSKCLFSSSLSPHIQALMPTKQLETNFRRFSAGAISGATSHILRPALWLTYTAGMISVFFTYPLEVIRVRMAFQTRAPDDKYSSRLRPSFTRAITQIYNEGVIALPSHTAPTSASASASSLPSAISMSTVTAKHIFTRFPILKFYRGFTVTIMGIIPYAGTSFLTWGYLRSRFLPQSHNRPTPVADLTIGALSGAISQTVSYPFEVVRRRMQVGGLTRPDRWLRLNETVKSVWKAGGWRGFFVGLSIGYLKIAPMTAVSYAVWQEGKRLLGVWVS